MIIQTCAYNVRAWHTDRHTHTHTHTHYCAKHSCIALSYLPEILKCPCKNGGVCVPPDFTSLDEVRCTCISQFQGNRCHICK